MKGKKRRPSASRGPFCTANGAPFSLLHHNEEDWYAYAEGFKRAADTLVHRVLSTNGEWDYLVYPVFFCYRHYLELKLKQIIRRGGGLVDEPDDIHPEHRLVPLWHRAKTILGKIWPEEDSVRIEEVIHAFSEIDPMSFAFRYPVDTKGKEHLKDIRVLSVRSVALVVSEIAPLLDGAGYGIDEMRDAKADAEYEAQQYYEPPEYEPPDFDPD